MPVNSLVVLQDKAFEGYEFGYNPSLLGGSIEYSMKMNKMSEGCTAGVYLVALSQGCDPMTQRTASTNPNCPSIDISQSNEYGHEMAAHPCKNGNCDA